LTENWQEGHAKAAIAKLFMVSLSSVKRYISQFVAVGHVHPTIQRRMQGKLTRKLLKKLARQVEVRSVFREMMKTLDVEKIVIVDESGTRIGMFPLYGRSWRGLRVYDQSIRNYGKNITLLGSLTVVGIQATMTIEGAVDEAVFEAYIEKVLIPTLHPGQIVMMDNLPCHKTERIEALLSKAKCQLLYLPAYSPDLSPIEGAFSKLKAFIRCRRCRTVAALLKAIKHGLETLTDI
jgi:transposase